MKAETQGFYFFANIRKLKNKDFFFLQNVWRHAYLETNYRVWSFLTLPLNRNRICVASQHIIPTLRLFLKTFKNFPQGKNNFPWESHGSPMGFPWEIWNSENNNQQHNYKVYCLSTSAVNRFCICLSTLHISYTIQVPQKRYISTFKILAFFVICCINIEDVLW